MSDSVRPHGLQPCQAPLSMGFCRQEYWRELPFPSSGDVPNSGIEPWGFSVFQADYLPLSHLERLVISFMDCFLWRNDFVLYGLHHLPFYPPLRWKSVLKYSLCFWSSKLGEGKKILKLLIFVLANPGFAINSLHGKNDSWSVLAMPSKSSVVHISI